MWIIKKIHDIRWLLLVIFLGWIQGPYPMNIALAQTSPVDLIDLTLEELMEVEIEENPSLGPRGYRFGEGRLHTGYRYIRVKFEGYMDGTDELSNSELLGAPPANRTYPVLPTTIIQEAHVFDLSYDVLDKTTLSLFIPYIRQSTDHISVVAGYDNFIITSDGLGDLSLSVSQQVWSRMGHTLLSSFGISFPTGSIDEEGDTPRDTGQPVEQLPYTMQLGSGTYDMIVSLTYSGMELTPRLGNRVGPFSWGAQSWGKIRTGENDRDYRLGHRFILSTWVEAHPRPWLSPSLELDAHFWGRIQGADTSI